MSVSYDKLWKLLIDKKMKRTDLKEASGISFNVLARMGKSKAISLESLEKICRTLDQKIGDVIELIDDDKMRETFSAIEIFPGAGGLALGLEKSGFEALGLIEFDKRAIETLKHNRPHWRIINDNLNTISLLDLEGYFNISRGNLDLLTFGTNSQRHSFSIEKSALEEVQDGVCFFYSLFLKKLQPKMFLFETVPRLLIHEQGEIHSQICKTFEQEGYILSKKALNAWHYGVPQKRTRLFIIGIRKNLSKKIHFEFPIAHEYKPILRDILTNCPQSEGAFYSEYKRKLLEQVPPGGCWKNISENDAKEYLKNCWSTKRSRNGILRRLHLDEPALTVLSSPNQKYADRCHPQEVRPFTVRENARCQTFPDEWQFCGSMTQQYKQIGSAVPVKLAYAIGMKIRESLESESM